MTVIPCEQNQLLRQRIEEYAETLKVEAHKLGTHGLSEQEFYNSGLFRGAIERIRGQFSATMREKRDFVRRGSRATPPRSRRARSRSRRSRTTKSRIRRRPMALSRRAGIVRLNSILPAGAPGRDGAPLFLLMNRQRTCRDSTPKMTYTGLP